MSLRSRAFVLTQAASLTSGRAATQAVKWGVGARRTLHRVSAREKRDFTAPKRFHHRDTEHTETEHIERWTAAPLLPGGEQGCPLTPRVEQYSARLRPVGAKTRTIGFGLSRAAESYAATVAAVISDHGPFSPRVLTQRAM